PHGGRPTFSFSRARSIHRRLIDTGSTLRARETRTQRVRVRARRWAGQRGAVKNGVDDISASRAPYLVLLYATSCDPGTTSLRPPAAKCSSVTTLAPPEGASRAGGASGGGARAA